MGAHGPAIQFDEAWSKADSSHNFAFVGFDPARWDASAFITESDGEFNAKMDAAMAEADARVAAMDRANAEKRAAGLKCSCGAPMRVDVNGSIACANPACSFRALGAATARARDAMERMVDALYESSCEFCTPTKLVPPDYNNLTAVRDSRYLGPEVEAPLDGGSTMRRMRYRHDDRCPIWQLGEARMQLKSVRVGIPI